MNRPYGMRSTAPGEVRAIALRLVQLATTMGVVMGLAIFAGAGTLTRIFTADAQVLTAAMAVTSIVAFFQPIDAAMLAQEGVLLGARQHAYISRSVIATSVVCFCALNALTATKRPYTLVSVWCCIKILTMGRAIFSGHRLYVSPQSPLLM